MNLIDRIKAGRKWGETLTDGQYVRELEAALLAADELARLSDDVIEENIEPPYGPKGREFAEALALYRAKTHAALPALNAQIELENTR